MIRRTLPGAVVAFVLSVSPVSAQSFDWTPSVVYAASRVVNQVSVHRFLTNGSGCTNVGLSGARPSDTRVTLTNAVGIAAVTGGQYLLHKVGSSTKHPTAWKRVNWALALAGTALSTRSTIRNVQTCPGGAR